MTGPARQFLSAAELAREYRSSMPTDALRLWAQDAVALLRAQAEAWAVVQAIADADPPIGRQEARMFAEKAVGLAQADAAAAGGAEAGGAR